MTIFLVSTAGLACTFYVYVLIQFLHDGTRIPRGISRHSGPAARLRDCSSR
jgi:hypothetical protein